MFYLSFIRWECHVWPASERDYFTKAITDPGYEKVIGYQNKIMPKPVIPKDDIEALIDYLIEV